MLRIISLPTIGTALGLLALVACSAGDATVQAESTQDMASSATTQSADATIEQQAKLPDGVTQEMVDQGKEVYGGAGLCYACHGADGTGMPNLGADLTDDEWIQTDGSYEDLIETIMAGVSADKSTVGTPMPPKGGSGITDEQVKAVAAYIYTLSR